jgi:predicted solute-binding protein
VDFGELNDKALKGVMDLSKIVSRFYLYIHEQPLKYLLLDEYYMAHIGEDKYMDDPNA